MDRESVKSQGCGAHSPSARANVRSSGGQAALCRLRLASGASLFALWLSGAAVAQDAVPATNPPQEDAEQRQAVITVYGTSNPIPVFDYPGQVSVVVREDIEIFSPSTVADMLRDMPGVDFGGGPRRTGETPSIRGLGGENVLILLDGARQSFLSAHDGRFFADPDLIRTAEAVRGPASALYGSGAIGGVLAFETVRAEDMLRDGEMAGLRLRIGYQDVNAETLAAMTGFTDLGRLDLVGSVGLRSSGDIALGSGVDLPSSDEITTGLLKATFEASEALTLDASWIGFRNDAFEPNNGQGLGALDDPVLLADVEKDVRTGTVRFGATFSPAGSDLIDARLTLYRTDTRVDEFDPAADRTTVRDIETTGVSVRNASRANLGDTQVTLTLGADWYRDDQIGRDSAAADGTRDGVPDGDSEFTGVFAQIEAAFERPFGLPGELLVVPGIRFDRFESAAVGEPGVSDEATSPRIAASYGPVPWLRLFASYAEGFRAPSINELYLNGVHFSVPHPVLFNPRGRPPSFVFVNNDFIPNPALTPEKAATFEAGGGVEFSNVFARRDFLTAKGSWYRSEVDDLINIAVDFTFDPTCFRPPFFPCSAGVTASDNITTGEFEGYELEALYDHPRFRLRATAAAIDGVDTRTGEDLGSLTPARVNLDARLKFPDPRAAAGVRVQVADDFRRFARSPGGGLVQTERRDGYTVVDLYATWRPDFAEGIRLDLGVDNVFDEDYERVFEGVSEPGRNARIAVSWQVGW